MHAVSHILLSQSIINSCLVIALFFHAALQLIPAYLVTEDTLYPGDSLLDCILIHSTDHMSQLVGNSFFPHPTLGLAHHLSTSETQLFCQRTLVRDLVLWDALYSRFLWSNEFGRCCTLLNLEGVCVCVCVCVCMLVTQSYTILCDPMDCSSPGSSVHGILQARTLEWVAIPFSGGSSQPKNQTRVSHIACRFFTIWVTTEDLWGPFSARQCVSITLRLLTIVYFRKLLNSEFSKPVWPFFNISFKSLLKHSTYPVSIKFYVHLFLYWQTHSLTFNMASLFVYSSRTFPLKIFL